MNKEKIIDSIVVLKGLLEFYKKQDNISPNITEAFDTAIIVEAAVLEEVLKNDDNS